MTPFRIGILMTLSIAFAWACVTIFSIRFDSGSFYPPYSSHSADPFGTKALFETLEQLTSGNTQRIETPNRLEKAESDLYLMIGTESDLHQDDVIRFWDLLDQKLQGGSTVAISLLPAYHYRFDFSEFEGEEESAPDESGEDRPVFDEEKYLPLKRWLANYGLELGSLRDELSKDEMQRHADAEAFISLPVSEQFDQSLTLKGDACFTELGESWLSLYATDDYSTVAYRNIGDGKLVVIADSFPLTNEGLLKSRNSEFLAWLTSKGSSIAFIELQHGVIRNPSIVGLARRHGFTGALLLVALAAGVYIWSSLFSNAPRREISDSIIASQTQVGSYTGIEALLRNTVPKNRILASAIQEWRRSLRHNSLDSEKVRKAEQRLAEFQSNTSPRPEEQVDFYNDIANLLKR